MAKAKIKSTSHINDTDQGIKMATKPANAAQKKWMSDVAEWANDDGIHILFGIAYPNSIQLHHVMGRSAKKNKVAIGHEFILPLPFELHDVSSNDPENVTHHKKAFVKKYGSQSGLFEIMFLDMLDRGYKVPSFDIYNAIVDTRA
jgi:hypothetical protein